MGGGGRPAATRGAGAARGRAGGCSAAHPVPAPAPLLPGAAARQVRAVGAGSRPPRGGTGLPSGPGAAPPPLPSGPGVGQAARSSAAPGPGSGGCRGRSLPRRGPSTPPSAAAPARPPRPSPGPRALLLPWGAAGGGTAPWVPCAAGVPAWGASLAAPLGLLFWDQWPWWYRYGERRGGWVGSGVPGPFWPQLLPPGLARCVRGPVRGGCSGAVAHRSLCALGSLGASLAG